MNYYSAFDHIIRSEIPFPELTPIAPTENYDTFIRYGEVIETVPNSFKGFSFEASQTDFVVRIHLVANYWIKQNNDVVIEPLCDDTDSIRLFFLSNVMAALIYKKGYIPLHASAVCYNNELVLFSGRSQAGKSTTVANLKVKGFDVFADDVCILTIKDNAIWARPTYPVIKLWGDSYKQPEISNLSNAAYQLRPEINKIGFTYHNDHLDDWKKINKIFFLETSANGDAGTAKRLDATETFGRLMDNVYRKKYARALKLELLEFTTIHTLANTTATFSLKRPHNFKDMDLFMDKLEQHLG